MGSLMHTLCLNLRLCGACESKEKVEVETLSSGLAAGLPLGPLLKRLRRTGEEGFGIQVDVWGGVEQLEGEASFRAFGEGVGPSEKAAAQQLLDPKPSRVLKSLIHWVAFPCASRAFSEGVRPPPVLDCLA